MDMMDLTCGGDGLSWNATVEYVPHALKAFHDEFPPWEEDRVVHVHVDPSFCDKLVSLCFLDQLLRLGTFSCAHLGAAIDWALIQWNVYSAVKMVRSPVVRSRVGFEALRGQSSLINLTAGGRRAAGEWGETFVAVALRSWGVGSQRVRVHFRDDYCYIANFRACNVFNRLVMRYGKYATVAGLVGGCALLGCSMSRAFACHRYLLAFVALGTIVGSCLGLATHACGACQDFTTVLLHELGHALGLRHNDGCTNADGRVPIMYSFVRIRDAHVPTACDVLALHSLQLQYSWAGGVRGARALHEANVCGVMSQLPVPIDDGGVSCLLYYPVLLLLLPPCAYALGASRRRGAASGSGVAGCGRRRSALSPRPEPVYRL